MKLYHDKDVALELIDDRDSLQKAININDEFYIPSSSKGIVRMIGEEKSQKHDINIGDKVYFDPRMMVTVEELKLVVVDIKSILIKVEG